jgi:hypothetical protein
VRYDVRALGKGKLAVAKAELVDPFEVAVDIQILVSHANDQVRLFGAGASGGYHFCGSPDGKTSILHLLTYAGGRGISQMTVWVRETVRGARLWSLQADRPAQIEHVAAEYGGTDLRIASAPAYGALELEV